jgi:hypothetical protein
VPKLGISEMFDSIDAWFHAPLNRGEGLIIVVAIFWSFSGLKVLIRDLEQKITNTKDRQTWRDLGGTE